MLIYINSINNKGMNTWGAQLKKVKTKGFNVPRSPLYGQTAFSPLKDNYGPTLLKLAPFVPLLTFSFITYVCIYSLFVDDKV